MIHVSQVIEDVFFLLDRILMSHLFRDGWFPFDYLDFAVGYSSLPIPGFFVLPIRGQEDIFPSPLVL